MALQPALAPAHGVLAKLQLQAGQYREAIEQCRRALAIDPNDQTALYRLIQALRKSGDKTEIPALLKRLAAVREQAAKEERERYRYKLVVGEPPHTQARRESTASVCSLRAGSGLRAAGSALPGSDVGRASQLSTQGALRPE